MQAASRVISATTSEVELTSPSWSDAGLYQCVAGYPGFEDTYSAEPATLSVRGKWGDGVDTGGDGLDTGGDGVGVMWGQVLNMSLYSD